MHGGFRVRRNGRRARWLGTFGPVTLLLILGISTAIALPRLSAEHGEACKNCHINPAGGGARSEYGNYTTALNELTLPWTKKLVAAHYKKPRVGDNLIVGFDSRHLLLRDGSLFRMQTDAYLTLEIAKGLYYHTRFSDIGTRENYALLQLADLRYSVKVGRFAPAYGLHMDDHTALVRAQTGLLPNQYLDGVSVGAQVGGADLTLELMDRSGQGVYGAQVTRAGELAGFGYLAGASVRLSEKVAGSYQGMPHAKGMFGELSYDRLTLAGEYDLIGSDNRSYATYGALTGRIVWGLYAVAEYNFFDPDRHAQNGVSEWVRYSIELYPLPFVQIRPSFTDYTRGDGNKRDEYFIQIHFGY
jgi:hypothetical protein